MNGGGPAWFVQLDLCEGLIIGKPTHSNVSGTEAAGLMDVFDLLSCALCSMQPSHSTT